MTLRRDMAPYIDGNELAAPTSVPIHVKRASDNGVLHSSRYLILQYLNNEPIDEECFQGVMNCLVGGELRRAPDDPLENTPDDHYGFISLINTLTTVPAYTAHIPWRCCHPALLYMRGLPNNPIWRLLSLPVALLIGFSNLNSSPDSTSDRLLTWNLIQGTKASLCCRLGAKLWMWRQKMGYGEGSTKQIAAIYYGTSHPFVKWWKE